MLKKISTLLLSAIVLVCSLSTNVSDVTLTQEHTPSIPSNEVGTGGAGGNGTFTFFIKLLIYYEQTA